MISVDTICLLQKKVESAVQKIEQLKSENDALRTQCSELTNALSEKTELLSNFMADEKKIESAIMSALGRLDSVENALLDNAMHHSVQGAAAPAAASTHVSEHPSASSEAEEKTVVAASHSAASPDVQDGALQENEPPVENDGFEFGADTEERDSLFGDTSFETDGEIPPQEIF